MSTNVSGEPDMLVAVRTLSDQFHQGAAWASGAASGISGVRRVVICGMGGSAFPGDFLALHARAFGVSVHVSRDYLVRAGLDAATLVIVSSFSGNTEETLASLQIAAESDAPVVTVSAGGQLQSRAEALGLPHVLFEKPSPTFQPRAAMGFFFGAFARILADAGLLDDPTPTLDLLRARLRAESALESDGEALAARLRGRIPVVYATHPFVQTAARVIKIKLNENSKVPAFFNGFPELNHNEMVGFTRQPGPFVAIMLRDPDTSDRMKKRMATTAAVLDESGVPSVQVDLVAGSNIEKLFVVLSLFDYASCYLAMADGIDPTPVDMVEDFKARMNA